MNCYALDSTAQNFSKRGEWSGCGINFFTKDYLTAQRLKSAGLPFESATLPLTITVNEIPEGAKTIASYLYWTVTGNDSSGNFTLKYNNNELTFQGTRVAKQSNSCWGGNSFAFRKEVTTLINKNGNYTISSLPTDTGFTNADTDGLTLVLIYKDSTANFSGKFALYDGYLKVKYDTIETSLEIPFFYPLNKAYKSCVLVSDFENESGTKIKSGDGPYTGFTQKFWQTEIKNSIYLTGQNSCSFGLVSPNDCGYMLFAGMYFQETSNTPEASLLRHADTIISTHADRYYWLKNDQLLSGNNDSSITAEISSDYTSIVSFNGFECSVKNKWTDFKICNDLINKNILYNNGVLTVDSSNHSEYIYQWYIDGDIVIEATNASYKPLLDGYYALEIIDPASQCIVKSDSIFVNVSGISTINNKPFTISYNNPLEKGNQVVYIKNNSKSPLIYSLIDITGKLIYSSENIPILYNKEYSFDFEKLNTTYKGLMYLKIALPELNYTKTIALIIK